MSQLVIGIDIGATQTKVISVRDDVVNASQVIRFNTPADVTSFSERIIEAIDNVTSSCKGQLIAIGAGAPMADGETGFIRRAANLGWKEGFNLTQLLSEYCQVPVAITNDANLAAHAEKRYGGAKRMDNFLSVTLGTGIGGGMFMNGSIISGAHGFAGEIGHVRVRQGGRACGCGRSGCLETYASANGLERTATELLNNSTYIGTALDTQSVELTAEKIADAASHGHVLSLKAIEITGKYLGEALADMAALLDMKAIFLSGGLVKAGEVLMKPICAAFEDHLIYALKGKIQIVSSSLPVGLTGVLGATALAYNYIGRACDNIENVALSN